VIFLNRSHLRQRGLETSFLRNMPRNISYLLNHFPKCNQSVAFCIVSTTAITVFIAE